MNEQNSISGYIGIVRLNVFSGIGKIVIDGPNIQRLRFIWREWIKSGTCGNMGINFNASTLILPFFMNGLLEKKYDEKIVYIKKINLEGNSPDNIYIEFIKNQKGKIMTAYVAFCGKWLEIGDKIEYIWMSDKLVIIF